MKHAPDSIHDSTSISSPASALLRETGFSPQVEARLEQHACEGALALRVARVDAQGCVLLGAGEPVRAHIPKRVRAKSVPVVGDWVVVRERRGELRVRSVLPRATSLTRRAAGSKGRPQVLAANLDLVLICMGLDRDFRLPRLERWLSLVHEGGALPVVVLTKAGLIDARTRALRVSETEAVARGIEVLAVDVLEGIGCDALERALDHAQPWSPTLALVGSSGVGKSTLLNHLALAREPSDAGGVKTGAVSSAHGKGRHTTSHRELYPLEGRALLVIDTPGLREVGLWGEGQGLDATFGEVVELAKDCRFSDCSHTGEPGCAVAQAIGEGELDARRVDSWRALVAEQRASARRASEHERRAHDRRNAKLYRATLRAKRARKAGA